MTAADFDNKTKSLDNSSNNGYSNDSSSNGNNSNTGGGGTMTRMHPSMKRPRAPIACFRCHHKKVRCDGAHPNCTRCLSTGVLCAYPSSRRSRNTQPTNVDPFIDNLSHLEARIRRIENDLESQRNMMHSICKRNSPNKKSPTTAASDLASQMRKTEQEVQESRSILAQLRLRGEQRLARGKRAVSSTNAAAAAAAAVAGSGSSSASSNLFNEHSHHHVAKRPCNRRTSEPDLRTLEQQQQQQHPAPIPTATAAVAANGASPFYYPAATDAVSFMYRPFDAADWSIFNNLPHTPVPDVSAAADANCTLMEYDSILTHPMDPVAKQDMQQRGIAPPLLTVAGDMPTPILRPSSSIDSSSSSSSSTQMPPNASDTFMPQIVLDELETNPDLQQALNNDSHSSVVTTAAASLTNTTITTATAAAADAITASITNTNPSTASTTTTPTVWYC